MSGSIQSRKKVNEQFGRKINGDMNRNRKLFWKEVSNAKGGKVESCSRIKDGNGRLALEEVEVRRIWKESFQELHNMDIQEQVAVLICGSHGVRRDNYSEGEPFRRT